MAATATNEIVVVDGDDWVGLYLNGKLQLEGHGRSRHADILAWGQENGPATIRLVFADLDWLSECGRLPENLSEVEVDTEGTPCPEAAAE